jgi:hypothetical protein
MDRVERRAPQINHQPSVLSLHQKLQQLPADAAVEPGCGGFPSPRLPLLVAGEAFAPPGSTTWQVTQRGALANPPTAFGRTLVARLPGALTAGWTGSKCRQTQEAHENKEFKQNPIHISCVLYKMSHFLANELFVVSPFIMLQIDRPWWEKLVHAGTPTRIGLHGGNS